jgi:hypothetical protein
LKGFWVLNALAGGEYARKRFPGLFESMPTQSRFVSSVSLLAVLVFLPFGDAAWAASEAATAPAPLRNPALDARR